MSNKVYDILKFITQLVLPELGTLYFALSRIWGFPYAEQIVGTITAIVAFLGVVLKISSNQYYKSGKDTDGTLWIDNNELSGLDINLDEDTLAGKDTVKLYVGKHSA